jgi:hypothetical protein
VNRFVLKVGHAAMVVLGMLVIAQPTAAVTLSPSTPTCVGGVPNDSPCLLASNDDQGSSDVDWLADLGIDASLEYKQDVGDADSGPAMDWYSTDFEPDVDPENATITWNGPGAIACPICYLIVKDGNSTPARYLFDLANWDGLETIALTGFWLGKGSISHVAIFVSDDLQLIPEPVALLLFGTGLAVIAARLRRRRVSEENRPGVV